MPRMAKRGRKPKEPSISANTETQGSRHVDRNMVSLPTPLYQQLKQLAEENNRPLSWELRAMVMRCLAEAGRWPPPASS
jgi:hypothetical protein